MHVMRSELSMSTMCLFVCVCVARMGCACLSVVYMFEDIYALN